MYASANAFTVILRLHVDQLTTASSKYYAIKLFTSNKQNALKMSKVLLFVIAGLMIITGVLSRATEKKRSCGSHGDDCSIGCCNESPCNAAAGRCMALITSDMLKEARAKLKPVQARDSRIGVSSQSSDKQRNCGRHGDSCSRGCCDGFSCNTAAGRCMATITSDMLKEGRAKLKPVNARNDNTKKHGSNFDVNSAAIGA